MSIPKILNFTDYNKYPSDNNPTTNADMQEYLLNQNNVLKNITASLLWQPNTNYVANQEVHSPDLPAGYRLICTKAGVSGSTQPSWAENKKTYTDGTVNWNMVSLYDSKLTKTGDTMSGNLTIKDYNTKSTDTVTTEQYREIRFRESDEGTVGVIRACHRPSGSKVLSINGVNGVTTWATVELGVDKDGNRFLTFNNHIPLTSNSTQLATTEFVKGQNYVTNEQLNSKGYATEGELESKADKTDIDGIADYIVDYGKSEDGTQWYRKWKSGWLEQGGVALGGTNVTLLKEYADTNYTVVSGGNSGSFGNTSCYNLTTTGFTTWTSDDASFNQGYISWHAMGQGADN